MKLGLCSYTTRACGVGAIAADLLKWLAIDSMLSVWTVKGQERWLERQFDCRMPSRDGPIKYLRRYQPDLVLGIETFFTGNFPADCREAEVKTALIAMQESYRPGGIPVDLFVCPTQIAYERIEESRKAYFSLPFDIEPFPFRQRTEARKFLHVVGYGCRNNRRQTREVIAGFLLADVPGATLTVHCQRDWREAYGDCADPRVRFRLETLPDPAAVYAGFDVLLQPDSYAGYNRLLYEAQACGLPIITTDAPPMNECTKAILVPVDREEWFAPEANPTLIEAGRTLNMTRYFVTPEAVADAVRFAARPGQAERSNAARAAAETRAWTKDKAAEFLRLLEASL